MNVFRDMQESACLSVFVQNTNNFVSRSPASLVSVIVLKLCTCIDHNCIEGLQDTILECQLLLV